MNIVIEIPNHIISFCKDMGFENDQIKSLFYQFIINNMGHEQHPDLNFIDFDVWLHELGEDEPDVLQSYLRG
jgi:hypothetical protein